MSLQDEGDSSITVMNLPKPCMSFTKTVWAGPSLLIVYPERVRVCTATALTVWGLALIVSWTGAASRASARIETRTTTPSANLAVFIYSPRTMTEACAAELVGSMAAAHSYIPAWAPIEASTYDGDAGREGWGARCILG